MKFSRIEDDHFWNKHLNFKADHTIEMIQKEMRVDLLTKIFEQNLKFYQLECIFVKEQR
jgi:hypothetical protein